MSDVLTSNEGRKMAKSEMMKRLREKVLRNLKAVFTPPANYGPITEKIRESEFLAFAMTGFGE